MSSASPTVSVCIPVYNGEHFLAATIESILRQDDGDMEVIISDNASTDGTGDVVRRYSDPRIRYCRSEHNVGPVGNFNRCLDLATGAYTKIVCADDILYSDCVRHQRAILDADRDESIALVTCERDIIDDRGRVRLRPRVHGLSGRFRAAEIMPRSVRSGTNLIGEPAATMFRTEAARRIGGFSPAHAFCLDLDFYFRILRLGDLYREKDARCAFRVSDESWSNHIARTQHNEFIRFIEDFQQNGWLKLDPDAMRAGAARARRLSKMRRVFYAWLKLTRCFGY